MQHERVSHLIDHDEVESIHTALQIQHLESTYKQTLEEEVEEHPALDMSDSNESDIALVNPTDLEAENLPVE